jgi:hypothetical protein
VKNKYAQCAKFFCEKEKDESDKFGEKLFKQLGFVIRA